jgi:peptide/nickel transport system permease protein
MAMSSFLLKKAGAALIVVFLASVLVFVGVRAIPGDPATALAGEEGDPVALEEIRRQYLLDKPLPVQYLRWISKVVQGDLGVDRSQISIGHTIVHRLPLTLELATLSLLLAILIGVPAGIIAAVRRGGATDHAARFGALIGQSVPHFWLGLLLITWFAVELDWLPAIGYEPFTEDPIGNLEHMLMPVVVLGTGFAAVLMRQTRSAMLDALNSDYVRTARAKGMSEWNVVCSHALRNSLITVVTVIALDFGILISGAVVTESIFSIPGFGKLSIDAFNRRDYPMIQGIVLVTATVYVVINLLADVVYSLLDPRIRVAGAQE